MGILVVLLFICIWYLPLFLKHRKNVKEPFKFYLFAFLLGIACTIIAVLIQTGVALALYQIPMSATALKITGFFRILILVAVVEEVAKFFMGRIVLKKVPNLTEAGSMLILGMTGIGFDLAESLTSLEIASAIVRGVLLLHLFFQLFMGKYWWRAQEAKKLGDKSGYKKNMRIALIVPIIVHAIYDYLLFKGTGSMTDEEFGIGTVIALSGCAVGLAYLIYTLIVTKKTIKAEIPAVTEPEPETEPEA